MSLSQSYPDKYPSLLYPPQVQSSSQLLQSHILPNVNPNTLGGNTAAYASRAVGGSRRRKRKQKSGKSRKNRCRSVRRK